LSASIRRTELLLRFARDDMKDVKDLLVLHFLKGDIAARQWLVEIARDHQEQKRG